MIRKRLMYSAGFVFAAATLALGAGTVTSPTAEAQSWPNQCWNYDGGSSCPICGATCMGGNYLCCNNGG